MKKVNLIVIIVLGGLGIWVIIDSYRLGLQTFNDPGPGLFPFLLGILLCLFAIPICLISLNDLRKVNIKNGEKKIGYRANLNKLVTVMVCLIGYFLLLNILGFLVTNFLFLFVLFLIGKPRKWWIAPLFSIVAVGLAYLIFSIVLKIQFPSGFLR